MNLLKKYWFWALLWFVLSVIASIIKYNIYGGFDDITNLTVYYTSFKFVFFPTLLTYIISEPSTGYFSDMILNHLIAVPIYLLVCYIINMAIKKFRRLLF
jgi:hypothetical protein